MVYLVNNTVRCWLRKWPTVKAQGPEPISRLIDEMLFSSAYELTKAAEQLELAIQFIRLSMITDNHIIGSRFHAGPHKHCV